MLQGRPWDEKADSTEIQSLADPSQRTRVLSPLEKHSGVGGPVEFIFLPLARSPGKLETYPGWAASSRVCIPSLLQGTGLHFQQL